MPYKPDHLKPWVEQINYEGEDFSNYYVASWRFFRCSPTERSNHDYIKEHLNDSGGKEADVISPTFTDEVMGFRYYVLVHKDFERGLKMADMFAERVERKGSLDPENEARVDRKSIKHSWRMFALLARITVCRDAGISIFAARSNVFPEKHAEKLYASMTEVPQ